MIIILLVIMQLVGTDHCTFNSTQKAFGVDDFRKIPNGVNGARLFFHLPSECTNASRILLLLLSNLLRMVSMPLTYPGIEERMHLIWDLMVVSFTRFDIYREIIQKIIRLFIVIFINCSNSSLMMQETGRISVTDYVRITSTEWYFRSILMILAYASSQSSALFSLSSCSARIFNIYPRKGAILAGSDADIIVLNPNSSFEISAASHHSRSDTNVYEGKKGKVINLLQPAVLRASVIRYLPAHQIKFWPSIEKTRF